jgi:hypothetical protein
MVQIALTRVLVAVKHFAWSAVLAKHQTSTLWVQVRLALVLLEILDHYQMD